MGTKRHIRKMAAISGVICPHRPGSMDRGRVIRAVMTSAKARPMAAATMLCIGSIDRKQVETLMARGLDEDKAVDVIVKGILR